MFLTKLWPYDVISDPDTGGGRAVCGSTCGDVISDPDTGGGRAVCAAW